MARKQDLQVSLFKDKGQDFADEDRILNYKPKIEWEEPPEEFLDYQTEVPIDLNIEETKNRVEALVNGYKRVGELVSLIQEQIDARASTVVIELDPKVDSATIAALKRRFPTKDPTKITYTMYKQALACIKKHSKNAPAVSPEDILAAKQNPTTTNLGGWGKAPGQNRAEISNPLSVMEPLDLEKFQDQVVKALYKLLEPMVLLTTLGQVQAHEIKHH